MGLSRSVQLMLLLVFTALLTCCYLSAQQQIKLSSLQAVAQAKQHIRQYQDWSGNGAALYQRLSQDDSFQFFQFIHATDGSLNFTHGSLSAQSNLQEPVIGQIFSFDLDNTTELSQARLQIRLNKHQVLSAEFNTLSQIMLLILLAYLLLSLMFAVLMHKHKQRIVYAAQCIKQMSELSFDAIESSKLIGALIPVGESLEYCRSRLKLSLEKVKQENEALTKAAYQDPVTGFATRQPFMQHLDAIAHLEQEKSGLLAMIKASELGNINQLFGRNAGDDYLAKVANCIRKATQGYTQFSIYRISSGDFAVIFADIPLKESKTFLDKLKLLLNEYGQSNNVDAVAHTGLVPYVGQNKPEALLSLADTAVSIAQTLGPNRCHIIETQDEQQNTGDHHWRTTIHELIQQKRISFHQQLIQPSQSHVEIYRELLTRFINVQGDVLPTTSVIAMAERYGLHTELDAMIVTQALKMLTGNPSLSGRFGVNISAASILQDSFVLWLRDILSKQAQLASRIIFEVNEVGMQTNLAASQRFVSEMHKVGSKVAVERFGLGFTSFKFFREVRPDYIKLDSSYSDGIEQDNNNRFFVRMIVDIAKRISIKVIATGVERQDEKLTLEKLLLDGLQGYYIAKPEAIVISS
ncbi:EAL domain-containing protein [Shewanella sp.]|uniref:EAL domain-containing protein n=2 Tax=Shewanella sp. TaxID=50422 RepID=UPI00405393A7